MICDICKKTIINSDHNAIVKAGLKAHKKCYEKTVDNIDKVLADNVIGEICKREEENTDDCDDCDDCECDEYKNMSDSSNIDTDDVSVDEI